MNTYGGRWTESFKICIRISAKRLIHNHFMSYASVWMKKKKKNIFYKNVRYEPSTIIEKKKNQKKYLNYISRSITRIALRTNAVS